MVGVTVRRVRPIVTGTVVVALVQLHMRRLFSLRYVSLIEVCSTYLRVRTGGLVGVATSAAAVASAAASTVAVARVGWHDEDC